jgi:hypothetical protein
LFGLFNTGKLQYYINFRLCCTCPISNYKYYTKRCYTYMGCCQWSYKLYNTVSKNIHKHLDYCHILNKFTFHFKSFGQYQLYMAGENELFCVFNTIKF